MIYPLTYDLFNLFLQVLLILLMILPTLLMLDYILTKTLPTLLDTYLRIRYPEKYIKES
jgi:hypothetical protein